MKKILCLLALLTLCNIVSFNSGYVSAKPTLQQEDRGGGGSGATKTSHYEKHTFTLQFETGNGSSYGFGYGSGSYGSSNQYQIIVLSCCIHTLKWWKECAFSEDDSDCNRFIDRESGKPYPSSTHRM